MSTDAAIPRSQPFAETSERCHVDELSDNDLWEIGQRRPHSIESERQRRLRGDTLLEQAPGQHHSRSEERVARRSEAPRRRGHDRQSQKKSVETFT